MMPPLFVSESARGHSGIGRELYVSCHLASTVSGLVTAGVVSALFAVTMTDLLLESPNFRNAERISVQRCGLQA